MRHIQGMAEDKKTIERQRRLQLSEWKVPLALAGAGRRTKRDCVTWDPHPKALEPWGPQGSEEFCPGEEAQPGWGRWAPQPTLLTALAHTRQLSSWKASLLGLVFPLFWNTCYLYVYAFGGNFQWIA